MYVMPHPFIHYVAFPSIATLGQNGGYGQTRIIARLAKQLIVFDKPSKLAIELVK